MKRRDFFKSAALAGFSTLFSNTIFGKTTIESDASGSSLAVHSSPDLVAVMGGEPTAMLTRALKELGGIGHFVKKGQKVVIKPNIGWDRKPEFAANTNPELIGTLVRMCKSAGASEVIVFDHTCHDWRKSYTNSGIEKAVTDAGGKMVPGNDENYYRDAEITRGVTLKKIKVHQAILDCDVWFNVPILKHHGGAKNSISMKNLRKRWIFAICAIALMAQVSVVKAQYPKEPKEVKEAVKKMMDEEYKLSDEAWAKALPIIEKEAKEGKPYIPWAERPTDLPQAKIPSFPGAEGGGMFSFGGRGGKVITVTNLNDRGPGSFREACETGGARIVVFNVSGIIRLKTPIIVRAPYITIAGQTAPGDGVCIAGESFWVNTHDVVVRHMRFRRGETNVGRRDDAFGGNPVGNFKSL
jgi:hypothetical protein